MTYVTYTVENIQMLTELLGSIHVAGVREIRNMAQVFELIESGKVSKDTDIGTMSVEHGNPPERKKTDDKDCQTIK